MSTKLVNLGYYRFFPLAKEISPLPELRVRLRTLCEELRIKGTILLAEEGINVMMSGTRESIDAFKQFSREHLGIQDRLFKESLVEEDSFKGLWIRIKKEIISVGDPEIRPDLKTAPRLSPAEMKQWLDERRPMILLDTRNDYEYQVGTFEGAVEMGLDCSRDFTKKAAENVEKWKGVPVVTFCTGGIRCEKASAALMKLGLNEVYQLDGGIVRYLEENGSAHFRGTCFVFDRRKAVDGALSSVPRSDDPNQSFGRYRQNNKN